MQFIQAAAFASLMGLHSCDGMCPAGHHRICTQSTLPQSSCGLNKQVLEEGGGHWAPWSVSHLLHMLTHNITLKTNKMNELFFSWVFSVTHGSMYLLCVNMCQAGPCSTGSDQMYYEVLWAEPADCELWPQVCMGPDNHVNKCHSCLAVACEMDTHVRGRGRDSHKYFSPVGISEGKWI